MRTVPKPAVLMADKLAREYVLARDRRCIRCGRSGPLEWAHILSRASFYLRWDPDNAVALCTEDHAYFTRAPHRFRAFIDEKYPGRYDELKRRRAAAEGRGGHVDIDAVIRGFQLPELTAADRAAYEGGVW